MTSLALLSQSPFGVSAWTANTNYYVGQVVYPTAAVNPGVVAPTNGDFSAGSLTGWTPTGAWTYDGAVGFFALGSAKLAISAGTLKTLINTNVVAVVPGQVINAQAYGGLCTDPIGGVAFAAVFISWQNASHAEIARATSGFFNLSGTAAGGWTTLAISGTAPDGAAFAVFGINASNNSTVSPVWFDNASWDYQVPIQGVTAQNYFTSITSPNGLSGPTEPDWTNGGTNTGNVLDGGVTWARGQQSIIAWTAAPFCLSAHAGTGSQPVWPTVVGQIVADGQVPVSSFSWLTTTPLIADTNCPQSKYVVTAASHVFAGDNDIVRFSAALDPTDWTSVDDAGFLPTGQQTYGANGIAAMGLWRSNLVVSNSEAMQVWQLDEDPGTMALLTTIPVGSIYQKAMCPVNDDFFFMSAAGVRSIGITGSTGSAQSGDVGMPIDPLVQAGLIYCNANGTEPIAWYYPGLGQYWVHFPGWPATGFFASTPAGTSNLFIYTLGRKGEIGKWSRYNYGFPTIDAVAVLNDVLYLRSGDDLLSVDPTALTDYTGDTYNSTSRQAAFSGVVQWPWLDFGSPGVNKQFIGLDIIARQTSAVSVSIGYDESNPTSFTTPFLQPADSPPGSSAPIPMIAPSYSIQLTMSSLDNWGIRAVNVYFNELRPAA